MNVEVASREMRTLAFLSPEQQERVINSATVADTFMLDVAFENWAHKNQLPPPEDGWRTWLLMAGRGFGKTRAGAEWIHGLAMARPKVRIALVGANIGDARSVMVEGLSGLLAVARARGCRLRWEPSLNRLKWPNGSQAKLFSGDSAIPATIRTACAARNMISPGATSSRSGAKRMRHGTTWCSGFGADRGHGRW